MSRSIDIDLDPTADDGLLITVTDTDGEPKSFVSLTVDEAWTLMDSLGRYLGENPAEPDNPWNAVI
jgi:hypothetical protein